MAEADRISDAEPIGLRNLSELISVGGQGRLTTLAQFGADQNDNNNNSSNNKRTNELRLAGSEG